MNVVLRNYKKGDYSQLKANLQLAGMYYDDMDSELLVNRMFQKDSESIVIAEDKGHVIGSAYVDRASLCQKSEIFEHIQKQ